MNNNEKNNLMPISIFKVINLLILIIVIQITIISYNCYHSDDTVVDTNTWEYLIAKCTDKYKNDTSTVKDSAILCKELINYYLSDYSKKYGTTAELTCASTSLDVNSSFADFNFTIYDSCCESCTKTELCKLNKYVFSDKSRKDILFQFLNNDSTGKLIKSTRFNSDNNIISYEISTYDANNNCIKKETFSNGIVSSYFAYEYDSK